VVSTNARVDLLGASGEVRVLVTKRPRIYVFRGAEQVSAAMLAPRYRGKADLC
jgi:hypothetical protein